MDSKNPEEIQVRKAIYISFLVIILCIFCFGILLLSSCQYIPQITDDIEKMVDDDAITIKCDKDCFQKDTDVTVHVEVRNKDKEVK